jgi:lipoate-protein ligase A
MTSEPTICDLSFPLPAENLACDEALLDLCEEGVFGEVLRFWQSKEYFVVLGYGNSAATEVHLPFCNAHAIPVLRRCTGGGTVLQGPGVLNYSLILLADGARPIESIPATNQFILNRHRSYLSSLLNTPVEVRGQTDLAIGNLKFSGNAQRRRKRAVIFHGSFLLGLDFAMLEKTLPMPTKEPEYRHGRRHSDFLMNLDVSVTALKEALAKTWEAVKVAPQIPGGRVSALVAAKYGTDKWNLKF